MNVTAEDNEIIAGMYTDLAINVYSLMMKRSPFHFMLGWQHELIKTKSKLFTSYQL
jgi:hypothetical protein